MSASLTDLCSFSPPAPGRQVFFRPSGSASRDIEPRPIFWVFARPTASPLIASTVGTGVMARATVLLMTSPGPSLMYAR
jgi:hypothetical protein